MRGSSLLLPPLAALCLVAVGLGIASSRANDDLTQQALVDERTVKTVDAGLRYLVRIQNADGSWSSNAGKKINDTYNIFPNGQNVPHVGVTSLAILALLAGGHVPGRGPHGAALEKALDFVLTQVQDSGYIASNGTRMYSHAFATLALAEAYGVTQNERVRARLTRAVEFTRKCQNDTGGWRYVPFTKDSDMSVTVCQVVALRAARNVGVKVPQVTIDRALRYVIESAITEQPEHRGAFWYQPAEQRFNRDSFALTAAGLTTLFQAGLYDDRSLQSYIEDNGIDKYPLPRIDDCVRYMRNTYSRIQRDYPDHYFYFYGNYYAAQAMYQIGAKFPEVWESWYRRVRDDLLSQARVSRGTEGETEAFWPSIVDDNHAYGTASALLILQFPLDQLPIHQR